MHSSYEQVLPLLISNHLSEKPKICLVLYGHLNTGLTVLYEHIYVTDMFDFSGLTMEQLLESLTKKAKHLTVCLISVH